MVLLIVSLFYRLFICLVCASYTQYAILAYVHVFTTYATETLLETSSAEKRLNHMFAFDRLLTPLATLGAFIFVRHQTGDRIRSGPTRSTSAVGATRARAILLPVLVQRQRARWRWKLGHGPGEPLGPAAASQSHLPRLLHAVACALEAAEREQCLCGVEACRVDEAWPGPCRPAS
jgi:hypothetical protein